MHLVRGDLVLIGQIVRTNRSPLDCPVVLANLGPQIVRSVLVVHVRRQQQAKKPDDAPLAKRNAGTIGAPKSS